MDTGTRSPNDAGGQMVLKVLVACETSGLVRDAFRELGHDAISCDILPTEQPGPHFQCDVIEVLSRKWDVMVAFPTCTYLCSSGMHWTIRGKRDPQLTEDALDFVRLLLNADIPHIGLENPVGVISKRIRKPDCIIHPWQFGHPESKTTCLWLKNLPALLPTNRNVEPRRIGGTNAMLFPDMEDGMPRWENQCDDGQNKLRAEKNRWKIRSRTYPGIAKAMAQQWSEYVLNSRMNASHAQTAENLSVTPIKNISQTAIVSDQATPKTKDMNSPKNTESSTQYVLCEPDPATIMMALSRR